MSAFGTPIAPHRFAEAIAELPLANLYLKAAEIRNSISHLHSSNKQLRLFADEGDRDCADAIQENREVIRRMKERVDLLRSEIGRRGFVWEENRENTSQEDQSNQTSDPAESGNGVKLQGSPAQEIQKHEPRTGETRGTLGNEEFESRVSELMEDDNWEKDGGLHL